MFKKSGQSIIEYCLLAMLIIVGTIVMGPYVIRSVNAHFKIWQESIDDSTNDRMTNVPLHVSPLKCVCTDFVKGGCGSTKLRSNESCKPDERYWYKQCSPPTCGFGVKDGFEEKCEHDDACCDIYNACSISNDISACCGIAPIPDPDHPRIKDPNVLDPVPNHTLDYRNSCYAGEEILYSQCDSPPKIRCRLRTEDEKCNASCVGNLPRDKNGNPIANYCPEANIGLTQDTPITLIGYPCQQDPAAAQWYQTCHFNNPFSGSINLSNFSPQSNYTLYLTPPTSHRLGIGIKIRVKIKDTSGTEVTLPCHDTGSGHCSNGLFELPNSTNPSWAINANDLTTLSPTGSYTLSYEWIDFMDNDGRTGKDSFGIAIALKAIGTVTPTPFTCPFSGTTPSSIDAGFPINACTPANCPNYTQNPTAAKCLIKCLPGTVPQISFNNTTTCVCGQSEVSASEEVVNAAAQAIKEFTSEILPTAVFFNVDVHTEDLNFDIKFFDAQGHLLHEDVCTESTPMDSHPKNLNNSCGGNDGDDAIDSYHTSFQANQVYVYVREGGSASSPSMGYHVTATGPTCHCGNGKCEPDLDETGNNCPEDCSIYAVLETSKNSTQDCSCTNRMDKMSSIKYCNGNGTGYRVPSTGTRSGDIPPPSNLKIIDSSLIRPEMKDTGEKWYYMTACSESSGWDDDTWSIYKIYKNPSI